MTPMPAVGASCAFSLRPQSGASLSFVSPLDRKVSAQVEKMDPAAFFAMFAEQMKETPPARQRLSDP